MAKVQALDLDKALARKPRNRIVLVGVELEGGWNVMPKGWGKPYPDRDGSVFKAQDGGEWKRVGYPNVMFGEIPVGPFQPIALKRKIKENYPHVVDASCGLHAHMSFETTYQYMLLADSPVYMETVSEYLLRWAKEEGFPKEHHIWDRLSGKNPYCKKVFCPELQTVVNRKDHDMNRKGNRYTFIHYAWSRYKTVECRALPMMETHEQATRAVKRLLEITNAYLSVCDKARLKVNGQIELDNGDLYEEHIQVKL